MTSKTAVAVVGDMPGCTRLVLLGAHLNSKRQDALRPKWPIFVHRGKKRLECCLKLSA